MTNNLINVFASEEYLLLFWLSKNLTKSKQKTSVRFSQAEIAEELNCSPTTINKRMRLLQKCKCIKLDGKKGYEITNKGKSVLKIMKKLKTVDGGTQV